MFFSRKGTKKIFSFNLPLLFSGSNFTWPLLHLRKIFFQFNLSLIFYLTNTRTHLYSIYRNYRQGADLFSTKPLKLWSKDDKTQDGSYWALFSYYPNPINRGVPVHFIRTILFLIFLSLEQRLWNKMVLVGPYLVTIQITSKFIF